MHLNEIIGITLIAIGAGTIIIIGLRAFITWFYKINKTENLLESINEKLDKLEKLDKIIENKNNLISEMEREKIPENKDEK